MPPIPRLEFHVTHACNLHCGGCSHYADFSHKGSIPLEQAEDWLSAWGRRLSPASFKLLGGEPTLHPDLGALVLLSRRIWPDCRLILSSNAFFIDRHPDLGRILAKTGAELQITLHSDDGAYVAKVWPQLVIARGWAEALGVRLSVAFETDAWSWSYRLDGKSMKPFADGAPRTSWVNCRRRGCAQIHENRLWKCPPLAYLGMQLNKMGLTGDSDWAPYLTYQGIGLDAGDAELGEFLSREDEIVCGMCPAQPKPGCKTS